MLFAVTSFTHFHEVQNESGYALKLKVIQISRQILHGNLTL